MSAPPLRLAGVTRRFQARVALDDVSLDVSAGELVGLVGPNGSGKTTLLKIVAGFLRPTAGDARVFGLEPFGEQARIMQRARFAFAPPALFAGLTAREHLRHLGAIAAPGATAPGPGDIEAVLDTVGLADRADERVRAFSFGMRQRLALAQALLPRPELLVLDEPTDGLDPLAILELRAVLSRLRDEHGTTILLSSHLLIEVENLVDQLLVLSEGRAVFCGRPAELTRDGAELHLGVSDAGAACAALAERRIAARVVELAPGQTTSEHTATSAPRVAVPVDALTLEEARVLLAASGVTLVSFGVHRPSLETAVLERLRREARTQGA